MAHVQIPIFAILFVISIFTIVASAPSPDTDWWKHAVFYQIYPRSFKDSDGDGIGDLAGITEKLDHFVDAGVTAIWLSPIYKSPQKDMGYDISDYRDVDPIFGSLEEMDELIREVHNRGLKIIMDYVPNHTSNEHEWFRLSEDRVEGYEDYYVWKNASEDGGYPNNWNSIFNGPAWSWSEKRQQYYLHQFAPGQPDLNYRNPKVVQEMKDVMTFWMDRGVDGFRIDAVNFLFEDYRFADEPLSGKTDDPTLYDYLNPIYTKDLESTLDMVYQWREHLDDYAEKNGIDAKVFMTEAYTDLDTTMFYYGLPDGTRKGAHFTFNFFFITDANINSNAPHFVELINKWYNKMPSIYTPNWVTGNHDNHRVATRLGPKNVDVFNTLVMLLPGVGVTYNAEEIGQEDGEVTFEECADPPACVNEEYFYSIGRDFERTPFQWDSTKNAGFSSADHTWLPVSEKYKETNLKAQEGVEKSHYGVYKSLLELRKEEAFSGTKRPNAQVVNEEVFGFAVVGEEERYVVLLNIGDGVENVDLGEVFEEAKGFRNAKVALTSVNSILEVGNTYRSSNLTIAAHDSFAVKLLS